MQSKLVTMALISALLVSAGCAHTTPMDISRRSAEEGEGADAHQVESMRLRASAKRSMWTSIGLALASGTFLGLYAGSVDNSGHYSDRKLFLGMGAVSTVGSVYFFYRSIFTEMDANKKAQEESERAISELREQHQSP